MNPAPADNNWQTHAGPVNEPVAEPPAFTAAQPAALPSPIGRKNPGLAAVLSAIFPGVGHIYNGLYMRGVTFFLVIASLINIVVRGNPLFGIAIAFFWLFNIIDAYRQATLINYGYAQDLGLFDLPKHPRASQGGIAAGVLLSLIGLVAIADRYFYIRLDWIFDLWPFALVGIGIWLVMAAIRDRRRV